MPPAHPPCKGAIILAGLGIALFAFLNVRALIWNLSALSAFKKTDACTALRAQPPAMAMTVNALIGLMAFRIIGDSPDRVLTSSGM